MYINELLEYVVNHKFFIYYENYHVHGMQIRINNFFIFALQECCTYRCSMFSSFISSYKQLHMYTYAQLTVI